MASCPSESPSAPGVGAERVDPRRDVYVARSSGSGFGAATKWHDSTG
jgi:hypothetical protein